MRSTSSARAIAAAAAGLAAGALSVAGYAALVEPRRLRVRRAVLALPHWPAALDGLRLVLLSDLHTGAPHMGLDRLEQVVDRANALGGDLVVLLGDHVDHTVTFGGAPDPRDVAARLGRLRAPLGVLAVLGNHDWDDGRRGRAGGARRRRRPGARGRRRPRRAGAGRAVGRRAGRRRPSARPTSGAPWPPCRPDAAGPRPDPRPRPCSRRSRRGSP
jgi:hypothetical protein